MAIVLWIGLYSSAWSREKGALYAGMNRRGKYSTCIFGWHLVKLALLPWLVNLLVKS